MVRHKEDKVSGSISVVLSEALLGPFTFLCKRK